MDWCCYWALFSLQKMARNLPVHASGVGNEINEIFSSFCIILCTSLIQMNCKTAVYFVIMQISNWNKKLQMLIVL